MTNAAYNLDIALADTKRPIYVKNNSAVAKRGTAGVVIITFIDKHNRPKEVHIPKTWIPIRLTDYVTRGMLRDSLQLRDYLMKRILILVHPDEAEAELNTPAAQQALLKMQQEEEAINQLTSDPQNINPIPTPNITPPAFNAGNPNMPNPSPTVTYETPSVIPSVTQQAMMAANQQESGVSRAVIDIVYKIKAEVMPDSDALDELRMIESILTMKDYGYLTSSLPEGHVQKWAATKLSSLTNAA